MRDRVYATTCDSYNLEKVKFFVDDVLRDIEKVDPDLIAKKHVFLKLNLLTDKRPEQFTTTHPIVAQAIIQKLKERGCRITLGDCPAGRMSKKRLKEIYEATGMADLAVQENVMLNYDSTAITIDGILQLKALHDAECVINVAKMKSHALTTFTGAVKNCYGSIPGTIKKTQHALHPLPGAFADYLVKVCGIMDPDISFIDGIVGMDGNGPSNGDRYVGNLLLASRNPFALDHVALRLLQIPQDLVGTDVAAKKMQRYGTVELYSKESWADLLRYEFKIPTTSRFLFANRHTKVPVFEQASCIGCGKCVNACPKKAIALFENKAIFDPNKCIKCYCCQEICPANAIKIVD